MEANVCRLFGLISHWESSAWCESSWGAAAQTSLESLHSQSESISDASSYVTRATSRPPTLQKHRHVQQITAGSSRFLCKKGEKSLLFKTQCNQSTTGCFQWDRASLGIFSKLNNLEKQQNIFHMKTLPILIWESPQNFIDALFFFYDHISRIAEITTLWNNKKN